MASSFYAVAVRHGVEQAFVRAVAALSIAVFLPLEECTIKHARQVVRTHRPLIPGYLFPKFDASPNSGDLWQEITRITGFKGFLGTRDDSLMPTAIRDGEIEALIQRGKMLAAQNANTPGEYRALPPNLPVLVSYMDLNAEAIVIRDRRGKVLIELDKRWGSKRVSVPRDSISAFGGEASFT